jgi:hypothetical protein
MIYIGYLPKDVLFYRLWQNARYIKNYENTPVQCNLTLKKVRRDINHMLKNGRQISITTYYGKLLYTDITTSYFDEQAYNRQNGLNKANIVIEQLKLEELQKTVLYFYKSK